MGLTLSIASAVYGFVAAYAKDIVLDSLIEAEATVLGFLGIIIVYALTSLDAETNRLEQQLFDITESAKHEVPAEILKLGKPKDKKQLLQKLIRQTRKKKAKMIGNALKVGSLLIVSLLLSILALGIPETIAVLLCMYAVAFFFLSIIGVFQTLNDVSKTNA